eukprot:GHRR01035780.1.p2 GENE.GHRR01035780.1~~GHRR01035780.1.p2  ORF type:complete len:121 (+),score=34.27 GHRR01035780.1:290-652(+)
MKPASCMPSMSSKAVLSGISPCCSMIAWQLTHCRLPHKLKQASIYSTAANIAQQLTAPETQFGSMPSSIVLRQIKLWFSNVGLGPSKKAHLTAVFMETNILLQICSKPAGSAGGAACCLL